MPGSRELFGFRFFFWFSDSTSEWVDAYRDTTHLRKALQFRTYPVARAVHSANWATNIASCSPVDSYDDQPMRHKSLIYCVAVQAPKLRRIRSVLKKPAVFESPSLVPAIPGRHCHSHQSSAREAKRRETWNTAPLERSEARREALLLR